MQSPGNAEQIKKVYEANLTQRFRSLDNLDRFVDQTQYEGRPDFFDDTSPLLKRAPALVMGHVAEAIRSHASMLCGHGRFPRLTTGGDEDDDLDEEFGLSDKDSAIFDPFVAKLIKHSKLQVSSRRLVRAALSCGTAVSVAGVRMGRLCCDTVPAKFCTPELDTHGRVKSIELRFPYIKEEKDPRGHPISLVKLYRRTIDDEADVTYKPADANRDGSEPSWSVAAKHEHGFGFCPVTWWKCLAENELGPAEIDGQALHATLLEELFHLDLARSQLHRAVINTLDPIMIEIGDFAAGFSPAPMVDLVSTMDGIFMGNPRDPANKIWGVLTRGDQNVGRGRKRAPGMAYKYPAESEVKLLTMPGDCLKAGETNVESLAEHICDLLHWRPIDPKTMQSTALSGRALHWLHKKQIDFDDELRVDFADHCLLPNVDMLLRISLLLSRNTKKALVFIPGLAKAAPILDRFEAVQQSLADGAQDTEEAQAGESVWISPEIEVDWPPYFPPNEMDAAQTNAAVRSDYQAALITKATAVDKLAQFYGIVDPVGYMDLLEKEPPPLLPATASPPADPDAPVEPTPGEGAPPFGAKPGQPGAPGQPPKPGGKPGTPGQPIAGAQTARGGVLGPARPLGASGKPQAPRAAPPAPQRAGSGGGGGDGFIGG